MFRQQQNDQPAEDSSIPDEAIHETLNSQGDANQAPPLDASTDPSATPPGAPGGDNQDWQHPGTPTDDQGQISDVISPVGGFPRSTAEQAAQAPPPPPPPAPAPEPADPPSPITVDTPDSDQDDNTTHELIEVKQNALTELSPLIDQLDLPAEERFRTIMMMIQASDDEHLVKAAYEAAHNIEDDKTRARALLDIVNEVNYFTQQPEN